MFTVQTKVCLCRWLVRRSILTDCYEIHKGKNRLIYEQKEDIIIVGKGIGRER